MRKLTRGVSPKFTESDYHRLQSFADRDGKCLGEWCRDKLLEFLERPSVNAPARALMAEIAATQNITITLLYEMAEGRKLSRERVQEILDSAHAAKYGDADERLKHALADMPETASVGSRARR
jgi:hypothetical protein